jgi:hypothetical protein
VAAPSIAFNAHAVPAVAADAAAAAPPMMTRRRVRPLGGL